MAFELGMKGQAQAKAMMAVVVIAFVAAQSSCGSSSASPLSPGGACPAEVAATTPEQVRMLSGTQVMALGTNIRCLGDAALGALSGNSAGGNGQIFAITPEQIGAMSPAQVRMLGATGEGGVATTSKVAHLNAGTWGALVAKMEQVAAITAAETRTLSPDQIKAMGTNIQYLTDAALGALSGNSAGGNGQIFAITPEQIDVLSPAQVRMLGATGEGGVATTSKVGHLNAGTWGTLVAKMEQVAAITAAETRTLSPDQIKAMGTNIQYLSDAALGAFSGNSAGGNGQLFAITAEQIVVFSPAQIGVIAATNNDTGITHLNMGAFASLTPAQIAILTTAQKASLSQAQHTACGC